MLQPQLFADRSAGHGGFLYAGEFISEAQEAQLLELIRALPFEQAQYREWRARRRIVSFGGR
ncbi:MAG: hypothetical protein JO203_03230, partial [Gammaproteobacteria bacterium]|nr:hypothetical protein [Gammaproteobacteria bacterium]